MSNEPTGDGPAPAPFANEPAAPAYPSPPATPQPTGAQPMTAPYAPPPARPTGLYQQQPQYQPAQYQSDQYQSGQYQSGLYQSAAPYRPQPYPPAQYQAGQYPTQPYQPNPYQPQPYQPQPYQQTTPGYPNWSPGGYPMPTKRRVRRKPMVAAIVALVLAVVLGGMAVQQYQASRTPAQVVQRYFAALAAGKASDALDFAAVPVHGPYLTSVVLAQQLRIGRISDVRVDRVTENGSQARANVEYSLGLSQGPRQVRDVLALVKRGSSWKLSEAAPSVELGVQTSGGDRVLLAGGALPTKPVYLFPGALPLTTDSASVAVQNQPSVRFGDDGQDVDLSVALTSAARATISQTLRTALTACFDGKSADPNCPSSDEEREVPDSLVGTVAPITSEVAIELGGTGGGEVELTGHVTVKGKWQVWDFNNQAVAKTGDTSVAVHAVTSVAEPTKLFWRS